MIQNSKFFVPPYTTRFQVQVYHKQKKLFVKRACISPPLPCVGPVPYNSFPSATARLTAAPPRLAEQTITHVTTTYHLNTPNLTPTTLKSVVQTNISISGNKRRVWYYSFIGDTECNINVIKNQHFYVKLEN